MIYLLGRHFQGSWQAIKRKAPDIRLSEAFYYRFYEYSNVLYKRHAWSCYNMLYYS